MVALTDLLDLVDDPQAAGFLAGIQGNIVKGHGRDFTRHVFVRFGEDMAAVRRFLARFTAEHVTTAAAARRATLAWHASGGPGEPFAMLALSAEGYRQLGEPLPTPGPLPGPQDPDLFTRGMQRQPESPRRFGDPPKEAWEPPYRDTIHALLLLADDDDERLTATLEHVRAAAHGAVVELTVECGRKLRKDFDVPRGRLDIEHFGFQDGVSQPLMIKQDAEAEMERRGHDHWDPSAPLGLALAVDPAGGHGSFMVFRKLEQDVAGFRAALAELAARADRSVDEVGAMAVGRHEDGEPAVPTTTHDPDGNANDFHFDQDPDGTRCPFHAHIRKTNPRGDLSRGAPNPDVLRAAELSRRIVRRGITYGERPDLAEGSTAGPPSTGVGLLFQCFQGNLDQFAIQQEGSDSNDFFPGGVGPDAVIGQNPTPVPQHWPSGGTVMFTIANFVKMLGGEYLYAPSMAFLRGLDTTDGDQT
jgi:deferrochelatase/peroxidase EfeB